MTERPAGSRYFAYDDERAALWVRGLPMPVYQTIFHDDAARVLRLGA
jgi:hypothetical protein